MLTVVPCSNILWYYNFKVAVFVTKVLTIDEIAVCGNINIHHLKISLIMTMVIVLMEIFGLFAHKIKIWS